jgi:hypothetical protein
MSLSSLIATLGWFPTAGGGGPSLPAGSGVPVDFRREEHVVKPLITVKNIRSSSEQIHEVNMSVISIKSFE